MAINPNTTFSAGAVYTADQANRFPRGIMAFAKNTTGNASIVAEVAEVTTASFIAVANRYYKITYYEPQVTVPAAIGAFMVSRIKLTNTSGTQLQQGLTQTAVAGSVNFAMNTSVVLTLTAGSTIVCGTLASGSAAVGAAVNSATAPAFIVVEDIGPA